MPKLLKVINKIFHIKFYDAINNVTPFPHRSHTFENLVNQKKYFQIDTYLKNLQNYCEKKLYDHFKEAFLYVF